MCVQFTKIRVGYFKIGAFAGITLAATAALTPSAFGSASALTLSDSRLSRPSWEENMLQMLEWIYRLMGGDPATLDRSGTAEARVFQFVQYLNSHAIPSPLDSADREALIEDIRDLYADSLVSLPGLSLEARTALGLTMQKLWLELGLSLSDLK